jgi:RNA polymerase sigma-70 factor (ECF subfamily)
MQVFAFAGLGARGRYRCLAVLVAVRPFALEGAMQPDPGAADPQEQAPLDSLVLAVARAHDRAAFAALFRHFAPRVKAYLMRLGCEAARAEELMQDAMVTVWRRAASFDPARASAATWIFTIARNKRIDALRRDRHGTLDPDDPALQPAPSDTPEGAALKGREAERVRRALLALPADQAELVRLSYFEDQPHSAIAAATALPLGTVKSRLRLALARLRKALDEGAGP